jgi:WD40 repeat protein
MSNAPGHEESKRQNLQVWLRFVQSESHNLRELPKLFFQQAANQPNSTAVAKIARLRFEAGLEKRQWLRWINKPEGFSNCLMTLSGHLDWIVACSFSPDGKRLASASKDGAVMLWNAETGAELASLAGDFIDVVQPFTLAFSPDGTRIVTASANGTMKLLDAETGNEVAGLAGHRDRIRAFSYSEDGKRFASAATGALIVWDSQTGALLNTLPLRGYLLACAISPDWSQIAFASVEDTDDWEEQGKALKLCDLATGDLVDSITGAITTNAFSPNGSRMVYTSNDGALKLRDARSGREVASIEGVRFVGFSPDGTRVLTLPSTEAADSIMRLWDATNGRELVRLVGHTDEIVTCNFSPDSAQVVSFSSDRTMRQWDAITGAELSVLSDQDESGAVSPCVFSPDCKRIVSVSRSRLLKVWEANSPTRLPAARIHDDTVLACAFSPEGTRLASVARNGALKLLAAGTGTELLKLEDESGLLRSRTGATGTELIEADGEVNEGLVLCLAFSPDGLRLVTASNDSHTHDGGTLKLWDVTTGRVMARGIRQKASIVACTISPDGKHIASASSDHILRLWNAETLDQLAVFDGRIGELEALVFSADGSTLIALNSGNNLLLWDVTSGTQTGVVAGPRYNPKVCAISPDCSKAVSGYKDGWLEVWDAAKGTGLVAASVHSSCVRLCEFSPDGSCVASISEEGTLKLWDWAKNAELCEFRSGLWISALAWSADGVHLALGSGFGDIFLLRVENLESSTSS